MLAIVCPGQGSQTPGFLRPWLELPGASERLAWFSACSGLDLAHLGSDADAETIKDTAVAQPLIVASGLLALAELAGADGLATVGVMAGHSVGEITAAAGAGVMNDEQAMVFMRERGAAMAEAARATATGMSAVIGGAHDDVLGHLENLGLTAANMNGAGQIVAAGTREQLAALAEQPPARARVIPLAVAGAFHTAHMGSARTRLESFADAMGPRDPRVALLSNADGGAVQSGVQVLRRLVAQVSSPVRWDLTMETLNAMGVTGVIELSPAGTLTGLAKRGLPGVQALALKTPDDLDAARRMMREHGGEPARAGEGFAPSWRVVVAPAKGTINREQLPLGHAVAAGDTIAQVVTARDTYPVVAPHGGRVVEWVVEQDDPVAPGQPLLRLHPEEG